MRGPVSTFEHLACSEEEGLLRTLFRRLERDKAANDGTYDGGPKLRYVHAFVKGLAHGFELTWQDTALAKIPG
jgi:hypothetical protein